jgi:polyferredoxin
MSNWTDKYNRCPQCNKYSGGNDYCPRCEYNRPIRGKLYRRLGALLIFSAVAVPLLILWESYWMGYLPTLTDVEERIAISVLYVFVIAILADIAINEP